MDKIFCISIISHCYYFNYINYIFPSISLVYQEYQAAVFTQEYFSKKLPKCDCLNVTRGDDFTNVI